MKKSLVKAFDRAKEISEKHPKNVYVVIDAKRKRAEVHDSGWFAWFGYGYRNLGYEVVAVFKAGEQIDVTYGGLA